MAPFFRAFSDALKINLWEDCQGIHIRSLLTQIKLNMQTYVWVNYLKSGTSFQSFQNLAVQFDELKAFKHISIMIRTAKLLWKIFYVMNLIVETSFLL